MALASDIDGQGGRSGKPDIILGEDWTDNDAALSQPRRQKIGFVSFNRSPLARKIITFNLLAILVLVAGVLYLNPFRDSLVYQRGQGLVAEAELIADALELRMPGSAPVNLATGDGLDPAEVLGRLSLPEGVDVFVYDASGELVTASRASERNAPHNVPGLERSGGSTVITDFLAGVWEALATVFKPQGPDDVAEAETPAPDRALIEAVAADGQTRAAAGPDKGGNAAYTVAAPILQGDRVVGALAVHSAAGAIDDLVRAEREQVLQMFVIATLVSIGLSIVLASTIANPLSDLASAAEIGRDRDARRMSPSRVRIPDLTARPDEIGRLSGALRGMVAALYDRIDSNEQFAADVAHEIKNPLASLRSAVGTLRVAKRDDQRERLLEVIEHDVRRLDRLVSDISNASRLDSELVKEEEEEFDLLKMLSNLVEFQSTEAAEKGIEFISDLPAEPIIVHGLEARLAQVFVNLISNAISFCEAGDAIRVWARRRENRVLVVVEDTGPGIPEQALTKIFNRFYSERPSGQFGNNSGLGLAISKQIVDAHGGVIWAENIRPTDADITSDPLGARFVVGLPL